jgi:hypothetical protein
VGAAVLCFLLAGCVTERQDVGHYGKDLLVTEQSILLIHENTYVTGFDGNAVPWGRRHHAMNNWGTEFQIRIPSGTHELTFKFNDAPAYDFEVHRLVGSGQRARLKKPLTKEFLPGHSYRLRITVPGNTKKRTIIFTDLTKSSGSESFVEDENGNWVLEQPQ